MKKLWLMLLVLVVCCTGAFAETAADFRQGGNGAAVGSGYFMRVSEGETDVLVRIDEDGRAHIALRADKLGDMIVLDEMLYVLMRTEGVWAIMGIKDDTSHVVYQFADGVEVSGIGARDGLMFVLQDGKLHILYLEHSVCVQLSGVQMEEFVIHDDYAYYISGDDRALRRLSDDKGNVAAADTGKLCRVNLSTGKYEVILDGGADSLKYAGGKLYFHNYGDSYLMGDGAALTVAGLLYSYDIASGTTEKLTDMYDWDFYICDGAVNVLREGVIVALDPDGVETLVCAVPQIVEIACTGDEYIVFDAQNMAFGIMGN